MTTKCQGENCTSTDGHNHSTECLFDHFTAYTQAQRENPEVQAKLKKAYFDGDEAGVAHTPPVQGMSNRSKRLDEIRAEAERFFEWPGDDRSTVTLTSCILFADHIAAPSSPAAPEVSND